MEALEASPMPSHDQSVIAVTEKLRIVIIQLHGGAFLDAHVTASEDFGVATRPQQDNNTQRWLLTGRGAGTVAIQPRPRQFSRR
jgi:hypothetical protein